MADNILNTSIPTFTISENAGGRWVHHDFTRYVKMKTGLVIERENTNDEDAGRDVSETMHTNVTSHQRKLTVKMNAMPFEKAQELERVLQGNDDGVYVTYPDLYDGICTRMFYNTSISAAAEQFIKEAGGYRITVNDISFTLISVKEELIT